ncbi:type VI secretion system baseplate subunit TssF [Pseudomonas sp. GD03860]|uniref:type VI secretion system baseplate subunit TssF n=1 Tax=Pseudomonas TaxID=286 RepID=UPI0023643569|nr:MULTISPECIES: type VI secretion system baseplate subunit TssF [Pseudomonas]MDD2058596.1 type VI secretion system baseplate subunit TssF [Pseudomonas putida]MDH0639539.1 type VI secretion system baseplate subunit TssF [Pseudomonas sp. GD03860]
MDERLLRLYERELQFLREGADEFAQAYPKVAGHLGLNSQSMGDPFIERLLEGLGFLTARIQLQLESEFPHFTENLLQQVQPQALAPLASMAVVQMTPDLHQGSLVAGFEVPAGSALSGNAAVDGRSVRCEWRTTAPVTLWPLQVESADYLPNASLLPALPAACRGQAHSAVRLRLRTKAGLSFDQLALSHLRVYIAGNASSSLALHEALLSRTQVMLARPAGAEPGWCEIIDAGQLAHAHPDAGESHPLHGAAAGHAGTGTLKRFLAFPQGQRFIDIGGLGPAVRRHAGDCLELVFLLAPLNQPLPPGRIDSMFALFCAPAQNLFSKRTERINLVRHTQDIALVVEPSNPQAHEIHQVLEVQGYRMGSREPHRYLPLYCPPGEAHDRTCSGYFQIRRSPSRIRPAANTAHAPYSGSDLSISLVEAGDSPGHGELHQLAAHVLCSNRDLPRLMPFGKGATDFVLDISAPVLAVRCLAGPSRPWPSLASGERQWQAIQHLSRNYLPLCSEDGERGAQALRELLSLHVPAQDAVLQHLCSSVVSVRTQVLTRRLPGDGPVAVGRGLLIQLTLDDAACEGTGAFALASVLEAFFARYVALNTFTQTELYSKDRGFIKRWPVRGGQCMSL